MQRLLQLFECRGAFEKALWKQFLIKLKNSRELCARNPILQLFQRPFSLHLLKDNLRNFWPIKIHYISNYYNSGVHRFVGHCRVICGTTFFRKKFEFDIRKPRIGDVMNIDFIKTFVRGHVFCGKHRLNSKFGLRLRFSTLIFRFSLTLSFR